MANETQYSPHKYSGNGSTTDFSFSWKIMSADDVIVQLENITTGEQTTKTKDTDYTVTFNDVGGNIHFNSAPSSDYYVIISRDVSNYQSKSYSTSTGFQGSEIENSFDKVSCNLQEVEYTLKRAIKVPVGSSTLNLSLPLPDSGKTLKWNESETALVNSTINVDELESVATRIHQSIDKIDTVSDNITDVSTVATDLALNNDSNIKNVAGISSDVTTVAGVSSAVSAVADNETNINAVNSNKTNIDTVAGISSDVTAVAGVSSDVSVVAGIDDEVSALSSISSDISTVAGISAGVSAVALIDDDISDIADDLNDNSSKIKAVVNNITNINKVANNTTNVDRVANAISDVSAVSDDLTNVGVVAGAISNVNKVGNEIANVDIVAGAVTNVGKVADDISNVNLTGGSIHSVNVVAGAISNVNAVAGNSTNINTVAGINSDVSAVAGISADVTAVKNNATDISTCATNISDINDAYENAQTATEKASDAGLSADSAAASERLARDWATKTNGTVDGTEYSAKYYAIQARDESAITFAQLYANLGYERTDLISDDRLYNCIYKYAHSTFDDTKFTATGTPIVNSNGIALGFSSSDYLSGNQTIDFTKSFKIVFNEKRGTATKFNGFHVGVSGSVSTPLFFVQGTGTGYLTLGLYIGGTLTVNDYTFSHADYTDINYIVEWDKTNYSSTVENAITHETILTQTVASATALENSSSSTGVIVYGYNFNSAVAIRSTDLKQTYVKNNGQLLFSGNQTGTDLILPPSSYTITGSTCVVDGNNIASGFSTTSGIKYNINYTGNSYNTFELYLGEYELTTINTAQWIYTNHTTESGITTGLQLQLTNTNKLKLFAASGNAAWDVIYAAEGSVIHAQNSKVKVKLVFDGANYTLYSSDNGGAWVQEYTKATTLKISFITEVKIGGTSYSFRGKANLNEIKTIIDSSLVFKLTGLSIPYTKSSHGTPVVDAVHYEDVKDAYSIDSDAFYYILDEVNKKAALPFGDIYSYIYKNKTEMPDLDNGIAITGDSYTAPAKGYIIGSGELSGGANFTIDDVVVGTTPFINTIIGKGQEFEISDTLTTQDIKFYPMKGA